MTHEYVRNIIRYGKYRSEMRPHEKILRITWVSNPATRKHLAARTWCVF